MKSHCLILFIISSIWVHSQSISSYSKGWNSWEGIGTISMGFETSEFRPEGMGVRWWAYFESDSIAYIYYDAAGKPKSVSYNSRIKFYKPLKFRIRGIISPKGGYGHFGMYEREILIQGITKIQDLIPKPISGEQIINHFGYSLSYNEDHEQANWVIYELTDNEVSGGVKRKNQFRSDPKVKTASASLSDYKGSGYDRGHLAPAADMKWSVTTMSESFYMSNMSPQRPSFNRGIWKRLEEQVRLWAINNKSIYVVTGGVLEDELETIGVNEVSVPEYFYKVILDYIEPELKGVGFIIPNKRSNENLINFAVSVDSVEISSGIDFFYLLPDSIEKRIESNVNLSEWFDSK